LNNLAQEMNPLDDVFRHRTEAVFHTWRGSYRDAITRAQAAGVVDPGTDAGDAAHALLAQIEGTLSLARNSQNPSPSPRAPAACATTSNRCEPGKASSPSLEPTFAAPAGARKPTVMSTGTDPGGGTRPSAHSNCLSTGAISTTSSSLPPSTRRELEIHRPAQCCSRHERSRDMLVAWPKQAAPDPPSRSRQSPEAREEPDP
jgi:hypothetical protein